MRADPQLLDVHKLIEATILTVDPQIEGSPETDIDINKPEAHLQSAATRIKARNALLSILAELLEGKVLVKKVWLLLYPVYLLMISCDFSCSKISTKLSRLTSFSFFYCVVSIAPL